MADFYIANPPFKYRKYTVGFDDKDDDTAEGEQAPSVSVFVSNSHYPQGSPTMGDI
jgi:hypothetical protein